MPQENCKPSLDFRLLFESAPGNYLVLNPDLRIVAVSNAYLEATMTSRAQITGHGVFEIFPDNPQDAGATGVGNLRDSLLRVLATRQADTMAVQKYDIRRPDSEGGGFEERFWSPVNSPVLSPEGDVQYIIHRVEDVTEFVRLRELGTEQEKITEALRTRAGQMESEIYRRSQQLGAANRQLRSVNEGLRRLYDQVAGLMATSTSRKLSAESLTPEETLDRVGQLISAHNRLEEQLRQAQKMEAVGRLAGGVAHDFNNLLTVIAGYASFAQEELADHPALKSLQEIDKAAARAASLTAQLLAFSRKQVLQPRVLDCNSILREMENMLRRLISESISLLTIFGSGVGKIRVDRGQLEQVIMNLAINARDAMPNGGRLVIETSAVSLEFDGQMRSLARGEYVAISVADTGHGMDARTAAQIFEPFFTTKARGKGTGLGLATVQGIVEQSGGAVSVDSVPSKGTTFRVYLPMLSQAASHAADGALDEHSESAAPIPRLGQVLIVEDEAPLRELVLRVLNNAGYGVLEAANGDEAVRLAQSGPVDLLLTDVIMPGISGPDLADRIRLSRPELTVLYMSGYDRDLVAAKVAAGANFLQKPFTPKTLLAKVAALIGSRSEQVPQARNSIVA